MKKTKFVTLALATALLTSCGAPEGNPELSRFAHDIVYDSSNFSFGKDTDANGVKERYYVNASGTSGSYIVNFIHEYAGAYGLTTSIGWLAKGNCLKGSAIYKSYSYEGTKKYTTAYQVTYKDIDFKEVKLIKDKESSAEYYTCDPELFETKADDATVTDPLTNMKQSVTDPTEKKECVALAYTAFTLSLDTWVRAAKVAGYNFVA
ncbi:MAG: hypothetical protein MJ228_06210 [Bacilli bacterium]|nr:hypothetical protein [Bacilli bacterium]